MGNCVSSSPVDGDGIHARQEAHQKNTVYAAKANSGSKPGMTVQTSPESASAFSSLAAVAFEAAADSPGQRRAMTSATSLKPERSRVSVRAPHDDDDGDDDSPNKGRASRAPSRQQSLKGTSRALSFRLADMVDDKSGTLQRHISRSMSNISNCSMMEGEGENQGTVVLHDEEKGDKISIKKQIGKGGFGRVYLGNFGNKEVAIKAVFGERALDLPGISTTEEAESAERRERMVQLEALLMSMLTGHPNIVHTYKCLSSWRDLSDHGRGVVPDGMGCSIQYEWFIVMEYCSEGSLWDNLMTATFHDDADPCAPCDDGLVRWDAWGSLELLKEVARALQFLHDNGIVHGDLKAANVLLAESMMDRRGWESKVTDFGFARVVSTSHVHTKAYGTVTHMPPELLERGMLTTATDVFSLGMLMWEVYVAAGLYKELSDGEVVARVIKDRARPDFPPGTPRAYVDLAARCWAELPESRPTASEVEDQLEEIQRVLCPGGPDNEWLLVPGQVPRHRRTRPKRQPCSTADSAASAAIAAVTAEGQSAASPGGTQRPKSAQRGVSFK